MGLSASRGTWRPLSGLTESSFEKVFIAKEHTALENQLSRMPTSSAGGRPEAPTAQPEVPPVPPSP